MILPKAALIPNGLRISVSESLNMVPIPNHSEDEKMNNNSDFDCKFNSEMNSNSDVKRNSETDFRGFSDFNLNQCDFQLQLAA